MQMHNRTPPNVNNNSNGSTRNSTPTDGQIGDLMKHLSESIHEENLELFRDLEEKISLGLGEMMTTLRSSIVEDHSSSFPKVEKKLTPVYKKKHQHESIEEVNTINSGSLCHAPQKIFPVQTSSITTSIPPTVPDIYGITSITPSRLLPHTHLMHRQFPSLSYGEVYWDSITFELLAFSDNFVHIVGKSKQDLILNPLVLTDATDPIAKQLCLQFFLTIMECGVKSYEMNGPIFRECDQRWIFVHQKVHFDTPGVIRLEYFSDTQGTKLDDFRIDGMPIIFPKEEVIDTNSIDPITRNMLFLKRIQYILSIIQQRRVFERE